MVNNINNKGINNNKTTTTTKNYYNYNNNNNNNNNNYNTNNLLNCILFLDVDCLLSNIIHENHSKIRYPKPI